VRQVPAQAKAIRGILQGVRQEVADSQVVEWRRQRQLVLLLELLSHILQRLMLVKVLAVLESLQELLSREQSLNNAEALILGEVAAVLLTAEQSMSGYVNSKTTAMSILLEATCQRNTFAFQTEEDDGPI
jgi:hypothetical protein